MMMMDDADGDDDDDLDGMNSNDVVMIIISRKGSVKRHTNSALQSGP